MKTLFKAFSSGTLQLFALIVAFGIQGEVSLTQEVTKVGTTAAKFLSVPVGARAIAMGGAFVAEASDASAMYWNPSGLARVNRNEAIFAHSEWIAEINFNYGGVVLPVGGTGTVGLNFTSLSMGEMERTTVDQPEGTGQYFTAGSFAIGISYARNLTEWFAIGGNAKYVNEHIWNSNATGFAIDLGTLFTTPFPGVTFGATVSNFGDKMRIQGDDLLVQKDVSPQHGNNPNINANLATDYFDLPLSLRIGIGYEPISTEGERLLVAVDATHPNDNTESVNVGGEYTFIQRIVSLRMGYKGLGTRDNEEQLSLGGGVSYHVNPSLGLKFDYAYHQFGRLSSIHKFAVGILF